MAAPVSSACRQGLRTSQGAARFSYRLHSTATRNSSLSSPRTFSSTTSKCQAAKNPPENERSANHFAKSEAGVRSDDSYHFNHEFYNNAFTELKQVYNKSSPSERRDIEAMYGEMNSRLGPKTRYGQEMDDYAYEKGLEAEEDVNNDPDTRDVRRKVPASVYKPGRYNNDFFTENEEDFETAPDEEFKDDDMTSNAHGQLEVHRDLREYSRIAAWEMPLLSKLIVPFKPPKKSEPFRWRYTTYLGTPHPAQNRVVLTFSPSKLNLTGAQKLKLMKLAGPRYDPHKDEVKISSESFTTQAQNKRYIGDVVSRLIQEAKDTKDSMADIALDFRHAKRKSKIHFPREWNVTVDRKDYLDNLRIQQQEQETKLLGVEGGVVEGVRMIEAARFREAQELEAKVSAQKLEMATAGAVVGARAKK